MRTCPECQNTSESGQHIYAVLNEINGPPHDRLYVARCHCSACKCTWDETIHQPTGDTINEIVQPGSEWESFS